MHHLRRTVLLSVLLCLHAALAPGALAGPETVATSEIGNAAPQSPLSTEPHRPFRPVPKAAGTGATWLQPGMRALRLDAGAIEGLLAAGDSTEVQLPLPDGHDTLAHMTRIDMLAPGAVVAIMEPDGSTHAARPTVQVFRGVIDGDPDSDVFLGVSATQAQGWIVCGGRTFLIATATVAGESRTVVYDASLLGPANAPLCAGEVRPPGDVAPAPTGLASEGRSSPTCRVFDVAVEGDLEFTHRQTSAQAAVDYAVVIFAAGTSIYSREAGMGFRLSYLRIWNREDPWTAAGSGAQLDELRTFWLANMSNISRSTVHLLSGRGLGGGVAYLRVACDDNWSFGVSGNLAGHFPFPLVDNSGSNWDVHVVTHELGHTFGSGHTHNSCEYTPIIDGCGLNPAPEAGCEQGTPDCSTAVAGQGTIMSYCHICAGGEANLMMRLGPRVAARIAEFTAGRPCATNVARPTFAGISVSPGNSVCEGETVTLRSLSSGPDLRYQWFRNEQRITGAILPTLTVGSPADGARYDLLVYSPCGISRTLGTPFGVTLSVHACCAADFDRNGIREVPDIFAFLSAWFTQLPTADFDGIGGVAVPDIFAFLSAWFAGC